MDEVLRPPQVDRSLKGRLEAMQWHPRRPTVVSTDDNPILKTLHPELGKAHLAVADIYEGSPGGTLVDLLEGDVNLENLMDFTINYTSLSKKVLPISDVVSIQDYKDAGVKIDYFNYQRLTKYKNTAGNMSGVKDKEYLRFLLEDRSEPDLRTVSPSLDKGRFVRGDYIAYQLAIGNLENPDTNLPFESPKELMDFLNDKDLGINLRTLRLSMEGLMTEETVNSLVKSGKLSEDQLDNYFTNGMFWSTELALNQTFQNKTVEPIFPYDELLQGRSYDIRYLPFLIAGVNLYLSAIPGALAENQVFPLDKMATEIYKIKDMCQAILDRKKHEGKTPDIAQIAQDLKSQYQEVLRTFYKIRDDGSWNRRFGDNNRDTSLPTMSDLRAEVASFGGRAPRNISIDRRYAVQLNRE